MKMIQKSIVLLLILCLSILVIGCEEEGTPQPPTQVNNDPAPVEQPEDTPSDVPSEPIVVDNEPKAVQPEPEEEVPVEQEPAEEQLVEQQTVEVHTERPKTAVVGYAKNFGTGIEDWTQSLAESKELGAEVITVGDIPNMMLWKDSDNMFTVLKQQNHDFSVSIDLGSFIWHNFEDLPDAFLGYDYTTHADAEFKTWYQGHLKDFLDARADAIDYLIFHAEGADTMFKANPDLLEPYCEFISEMSDFTREHSSHVQTGVYLAHYANDEVLTCINRGTDIWVFAIFGGDEGLTKVSQTKGIFDRHIRLANGKKVAVQQAGWGTSKSSGRSEEGQKEFVIELYDIMRENAEDIEYVSFYQLHDETRSITENYVNLAFTSVSQDYRDKLIDDLSTLGLIKDDGTKKPAWDELKKQMAEFKNE